ncbi:hypothetical protein STEG23_033073, partial [Scotinomys teguina]
VIPLTTIKYCYMKLPLKDVPFEGLGHWGKVADLQLEINADPISDCVDTVETLIASHPETRLPFRPLSLSCSHFCLKSSMEQARVQRTEGIIWEQRLHLPPDLSDTVNRSSKQDLAESAKLLGPGCGMMAGGKKHLDF